MKRLVRLEGVGALIALLPIVLVPIVSAPIVHAHIPLRSSNGAGLHWALPSSISIVINQTGSDDITDGSHITALQNAIRTWNEPAGSAARLVENTSPSQRARTDWQADGLHLMYFDEDGSSGYLPYGSGIVAITPVWYASNGAITDADVLFNGRDYQFTTRGQPGCFDVQDVATHELGHFLGLDHSGWAGATMYPYVDPTIILHRSLTLDEVSGLRALYPSTDFGTFTGVLRRSNDAAVQGALIVARGADGRPVASALTSSSGAFGVRGLRVGDYTLYATPLDAPVSSQNLSGSPDLETDFQTTEFGTFTLLAPEVTVIGDLTVLPDTAVGLGRSSDVFPVRCLAGRTRSVTLHGSGLAPGSTLAASDPSLTITPLAWSSSLVSFQVTVPADEPSGNVDLTATNASGSRSTLVGALEITPPDPTVVLVSPARGSLHGGTPLTITGTNFRRGDRVVLGSRIYADGVIRGCLVVDANTITLTTLPDDSRAVDVVVIDATGVEGRALGGFAFESQPSIASVFPTAGTAAGGTPIVLVGSDFVSGCSVTIDGVVQSGVEFVSSSKLAFTTGPGLPGAPATIEVTNPMGETATALFSYSADPDPLISLIDPAAGPDEGGSIVTIHGANFSPMVGVYFGADGDTGRGGAVATSFTYVDANTLRVVTPAFSSGARTVVVFDAASNQAAVAPAAYVYESSGGGGGGCAAGSIGPTGHPFDGASGLAALALAFALLVVRARAARPLANTVPEPFVNRCGSRLDHEVLVRPSRVVVLESGARGLRGRAWNRIG